MENFSSILKKRKEKYHFDLNILMIEINFKEHVKQFRQENKFQS